MKQLLFYFLVSVFIFPSFVSANEASNTDCDTIFSQADMHDCLIKKDKDSQNVLEKTERHAQDSISKWDENMSYIKLAQKKISASNKEFSKYRDSQCDFLASLTGGAAGNAHENVRLRCAIKLNESRSEELHDAISPLSVK